MKNYHVVLNEGAVPKSFLSQEVKLFNMPKFSEFFRWGWAKLQNNEYVIEGFTSTADNQSFDNQKNETLEDIAEMSAVGNEQWNIQKVNLPITYGYYQT